MSIWTGLHDQSDEYLASLVFLFAARLTTLETPIDFQNGAEHSDIEAQKIRLENSVKCHEALNNFCDSYKIDDEFERTFLSTFTYCLAAGNVGLVGDSHQPDVVLESLEAYLAMNEIDLKKIEINYLIRSFECC